MRARAIRTSSLLSLTVPALILTRDKAVAQALRRPLVLPGRQDLGRYRHAAAVQRIYSVHGARAGAARPLVRACKEEPKVASRGQEACLWPKSASVDATMQMQRRALRTCAALGAEQLLVVVRAAAA